jgi:hypothetical protein
MKPTRRVKPLLNRGLVTPARTSASSIQSAMADRFVAFRRATAAALLERRGATPSPLRQAIAAGSAPPELMPLVHKIRSAAYTVTDHDLETLRSRYTEEQLFEIIVAAAFGAANTQLAAAHRALEQA